MLFMEVAQTTDMTSILELLGSVFTFLTGKITAIVSIIMAQPLLLIPIGVTLGYVIFRFFRMIFRWA